MRAFLAAGVMLLVSSLTVAAQQIDYAALWANATPFHMFLENARAREEQWRSRFSNAAIEAAALTSARALPGKRRILAVAEDRCSDSAWAVPYLAKLAAAVPEKLELRVIGRSEGSRIQSEHMTPDGRRATPTIVVLDDKDAFIGAWVERPAELQKWFLENKPKISSDELHQHMDEWYTTDAGRSTVNEVLAILNQTAAR
jgi:hypothetical protein